jgi:hypothetical protein
VVVSHPTKVPGSEYVEVLNKCAPVGANYSGEGGIWRGEREREVFAYFMFRERRDKQPPMGLLKLIDFFCK